MILIETIVILAIFYKLILLKDAICEIQSFAVAPTNKEVLEGQTIIIPCQVSNKQGSVQWSKDGVLLGFDPQIPGYPRYSLVGDSALGIYDLKIENAQLEDDASFECQVGPAEGHDAIKETANLTVLLPPTSIQILDKPNGTIVKVKMGASLSLSCEISGGKPAPKVIWKKDNFKLPNGNTRVSITDEDNNRQKIVSTLTLNPTSDDNGVYYSCESQSNFTSLMLFAGITLDVQYPPGRPTIEGYRMNEKIRAGDTVQIRCVSRGGNPLAWLVWTKNGDFVDHSYMTLEGEAVNEITFVAAPSDDKAVYLCTASSSMTLEPMVKSITLKVLYAPSSVSIEAPTEAKPGDVISATCKTERSNPAAEVTWVVDGVPLVGENTLEDDTNGGWITKSMINVNVTQQDRNSKLFTCYAVNQELGETKAQTLTVSILYAPDPPSIFGYTEGTAIAAGKLQRVTCVSHGGNPLPELKWYKGDDEVKASKQTASGNIISRELIILTGSSDNGARYQCKSKSKALSEPLVSSIRLTVYFPPSNVTIKVNPKKPKSNAKVKLTCQSTVSNPAANITWWKGRKNEIELTSSSESVSPTKDGGGFISKASFTTNVTEEDDGSMYTCQAENEAIQQSVHDTIVLSVLYKPIFKNSDPATFEVKENETIVIDVTAKANPSDVTYKWSRGGEVIQEGPFLNITSAERTQSGEYSCQAVNEMGETTLTVILKVLYPANITKPDSGVTSNVIIVEPESNVKLQCIADGYPLTDKTLKWKRDNFDMEGRTEILAKGNGKLSMGIRNATQDVSGEFTCIADNGIGTPDSWTIYLLVKHAPTIQEDVNGTVSSDRGVSTQLYCTAEGVPEISFIWSLEGVVISEKNNPRKKSEVFQLDHSTWQGILTIDGVIAEDFGEYKCVARNQMGFDTTEINLLPDSAPDPPIIIRVLNVTSNSFYLAWVPGFNGGHNQTHRIRYKSIFDLGFSYIDVHPNDTNYFLLQDLKPDMEYEIAIMASNEKGNSPYTTHVVKAKTLEQQYKPSIDGSGYSNGFNDLLVEILVSTVGTVFLLLLLFNIVLLSLYYHKKTPKRKKEYSDYDLSSSSDVSVSSKVDSGETTFTEDGYDFPKDITSTYDTVSTHTTESKSESYSTAEEDETEEHSLDLFYEPKHFSGAFV